MSNLINDRTNILLALAIGILLLLAACDVDQAVQNGLLSNGASLAAESPLVSDVPTASYRGPDPYNFGFEYELVYLPAQWIYTATGNGEEALVHQQIDDCRLSLSSGPMGVIGFVKDETLAGREWSAAQLGDQAVSYVLPYDRISFIYDLMLPAPIERRAAQNCMAAAEVVLDTFTIVDNTPNE